MRSWVFDTNVIISGHPSPLGPPGRLLTEWGMTPAEAWDEYCR